MNCNDCANFKTKPGSGKVPRVVMETIRREIRKTGLWDVAPGMHVVINNAIDSLIEEPEPVFPAPQFKPGDKAYCIPASNVVAITAYDPDDNKYRVYDGDTGGWVSASDLRPLTDADWTREIGGVKVRAYEDKTGDILLYSRSRRIYLPSGDSRKLARELCRLAGIPIMPFELHKGNRKAPE